MTLLGHWHRSLTLIALPLLAVALLPSTRAAEEPKDVAEDPLPLDSQWKGKLSQIGKAPDGEISPGELSAVLTITRRQGNDFEAELREWTDSLDITFLVRGRIVQGADKTLTIDFKSYDVKGAPNTSFYYVNVPYTAKLAGETVKGSWAYDEKDNGTALAGDFTLKRGEE